MAILPQVRDHLIPGLGLNGPSANTFKFALTIADFRCSSFVEQVMNDLWVSCVMQRLTTTTAEHS